jgi:hypothetical protein
VPATQQKQLDIAMVRAFESTLKMTLKIKSLIGTPIDAVTMMPMPHDEPSADARARGMVSSTTPPGRRS